MIFPGASTAINFKAPLEETVTTIKECCPILEISALRAEELPAAISAVSSAVHQFKYVSLHLPDRNFSWRELPWLVQQVSATTNFIVHPHVIWPALDAWGELL